MLCCLTYGTRMTATISHHVAVWFHVADTVREMFSEANGRLSLATCTSVAKNWSMDTDNVRFRQSPFLGDTHMDLAVSIK